MNNANSNKRKLTEHEEQISFHDAGLIGIHNSADGTICLRLEGIHVNSGTANACVTLKGVRQILRDGLPIESFVMEHKDAEILTLKKQHDSLDLIVEWNDFENHLQETRSYIVPCDSAEIELL
jgi:hypothetical protein